MDKTLRSVEKGPGTLAYTGSQRAQAETPRRSAVPWAGRTSPNTEGERSLWEQENRRPASCSCRTSPVLSRRRQIFSMAT